MLEPRNRKWDESGVSRDESGSRWDESGSRWDESAAKALAVGTTTHVG
jgi:hypothetical protein